MSSRAEQRKYKPGEIVDKAGIYRVIHQLHRAPHEVTVFLNDVFPKCRTCGQAVRFELLLSADSSASLKH
jgi:hypothetical protein